MGRLWRGSVVLPAWIGMQNRLQESERLVNSKRGHQLLPELGRFIYMRDQLIVIYGLQGDATVKGQYYKKVSEVHMRL